MKIKMWKLLIVALAATTALVGCQDERNNFMVDDSISFVNADIAGVSVYNEKYELAILKNGKGQQSAAATVVVSETALANYNTANGTNFVAMPANCYKLASTNVKFSEKETRKLIDITWKKDDVLALDKNTAYVIPVQLSVDNGALNVDKNRNIRIIQTQLSTVSMGTEKVSPIRPKASREEVLFEGSAALNAPISITDVTVTFTVDNSLIAEYNTANGTNYKAAPDGFAIPTTDVLIPAGQTVAKFTCKLNSAKLFTGNELIDTDDLLVPIRLTSTSVDGISIDKAITYVPIAKTYTLKGPWAILEGQNNCYGKDPTAPGWALQYVTERLFDGVSGAGGEWISSWERTSNISFPQTFVADMGEAQVFTKFLITDHTTHQGQYRDYEIYTAEEYDGANTKWNLVAKGMRGFNWSGALPFPPAYEFPVQKMIAGRYLKFMIMKPENSITSVDYMWGRGKLGDVRGIGF